MSYEDQDEESFEPTPSGLAHWIQEQYLGDDRFESVDLLEPGQLEDEAVRVKFACNTKTHFFVAVLEDDSVVRVGLATEEQFISESIETAALESGDSLTEFMEEEMESDDELEHEVQHFHDDMFYFCSDLPFLRAEDLASPHMRDEIIYYLDGYMNAFYDYVEKDEEA